MAEHPLSIEIVSVEPPPVDREPDVVPGHWRVMEDNLGRKRLLLVLRNGLLADGQYLLRVRVTSAIARLDPRHGMVETRSGRRYWLECPPSCDGDLVTAMRFHATGQGLEGAEDVSAEMWAVVQPRQQTG